MCDFDETRITAENAKDLCDPEINASAGHWQQCLQEICRLLEAGAERPVSLSWSVAEGPFRCLHVFCRVHQAR